MRHPPASPPETAVLVAALRASAGNAAPGAVVRPPTKPSRRDPFAAHAPASPPLAPLLSRSLAGVLDTGPASRGSADPPGRTSGRVPRPSGAAVDFGPAASGTVPALHACLRVATLGGVLAAAACAATPDVGNDVVVTGMPNAELALRESMRRVDAEMAKLGVMGPGSVERFSAPVLPAELQKPVTFAWSGTLEDGVRKLAQDVGYAVYVGPLPAGAASLRVEVATGRVQIFQAFVVLGEAAGSRATVRVDPARQRVDVIYRA